MGPGGSASIAPRASRVILATVERLAKPGEPRAVHMHAGCFPVFKRMGRPITNPVWRGGIGDAEERAGYLVSERVRLRRA